jgi:hypothetical protein
VEIIYTPDIIDEVIGFREEDYYRVQLRCAVVRDGAVTDDEYPEMLQELAMLGMDWRYTTQGVRAHLQAT